ncbi:acyltransferase family protein [Cellulomonas sp. HZM]|uniref:acyltransferase family protein n=1 Tax=Cellulomonas sp. HZM TaxID=1454010 RepID=UPI0012DE0728|nr:acyltransferase family protein [Cellulomonas sp. HZM]
MTAATLGETSLARRRPRAGHFRPDVEGLRAVAIGLVLAYHAGLRFVPGGFVGVDVFFVISGFLITGLLVREIERSGRLSLVSFYARRAKRLLPATAVVLVATGLLTWLWLPVTQRQVFGGDVVASALYVVNWRLAARSVDYLAEGVVTSPVQHFWSLAVEEQFYVVWPVVIVGVVHLARRRGVKLSHALWIGLGLIAVLSFGASVLQTASSPEQSFFLTSTRLWELAAGAGVALAAPRLRRLPVVGGGALVVAGLGGIVASGLLIDASASWPGSLAALPVLGAASVLAGGIATEGTGPSRVLAVPPLVWLGGLSYSLYLWHWPLLVAAQGAWGELGARRGMLVVAAAFVPAWLCHRFVENPIRHGRRYSGHPGAVLRLGAVATIVGVCAGLALIIPDVIDRERTNQPDADALGAAALRADRSVDWALVDEVASITPAPAAAPDDVPVIYADGCQDAARTAVTCTYGDPASSSVIALVGDSKAAQWQSALDPIARRNGWKLVTVLKSSCAFADGAVIRLEERYSDCADWNKDALRTVLEMRPRAVVTSQGGFRALKDPLDARSADTPQAMIDGLASRWAALEAAGIPVVALLGNPGPSQEIYECVAEHLDNLSACTFTAPELVADVQREAASRVPGVEILDLNDQICPSGVCPPVIGDVLVYRQGSHLTKTYIDSLEPVLEQRLLSSFASSE